MSLGSVRDGLGGAPAVEAPGEPLALLPLDGEEQLPRPLGLLGPQVLDIHLRGLVG